MRWVLWHFLFLFVNYTQWSGGSNVFLFTPDVTLSAFVAACVVGWGGAMEVWLECEGEG